MGWYSLPRWGTPFQGGGGGSTPQTSTACTCYAVGGVPLAFKQKDFLVYIDFNNNYVTSVITALTSIPTDDWCKLTLKKLFAFVQRKCTIRTTFPECTVVPLLLGAEAVIAPGAVVGGFGVAAVVLGDLEALLREVRGGVGRLQGPAGAGVAVLRHRLLTQVTLTLPVIVRTAAICNTKRTR